MLKLVCKFEELLSSEKKTSKAGRDYEIAMFRCSYTDGAYAKVAVFKTLNPKIVEIINSLRTGDEVTVTFAPTANQFKDRWYVDNEASYIVKTNMSNSTPRQSPAKEPAADMMPDNETDDMPF